jgi:hypothetical protein
VQLSRTMIRAFGPRFESVFVESLGEVAITQ